jgi:dolichol-phosphate mannosyltransferase
MADGTDRDARNVRLYRIAFGLILLGAFVFRSWFITTLPLSGDEAYHWEWSRNLAFGYYDHPGLTAYLIRLFTWLFGRSTELSVRMPALVMLTGTAIVTYLLARLAVKVSGGTDIEAERSAFLGGVLIVIIPLFAVFSVYISTDPPVIFFSSLSLYLYFRAFFKGTWPSWIGAGIALGLAMMSKFLAFLIVPAVVLFALMSAEDRKWFARPHAYVSALCALLTFSPVIFWNATHKWATFMFNFVYRQEDNVFDPWHALEFIGGQALALSPGIFLFAIFCLWKAFRVWFVHKDRVALFLGVSSLVPLLYFLVVGLKRQVGVHWPAAGWIGAVVFVAGYLAADRGEDQRVTVRGSLGWASVALCLVMTGLLHAVIHIKPGTLVKQWSYWGDPDRINTAALNERYGWRELGQWVRNTQDEMVTKEGQTAKDVFVFTGQYGLSAAISFYMPGQAQAHLWSPRRVHGENYRFWDDYASLKGKNGIFVAKDEKRIAGTISGLQAHFAFAGQPERIAILVDGKEARCFFLVRCYDFDGVEPRFDSDKNEKDHTNGVRVADSSSNVVADKVLPVPGSNK